MAAAQQQLSELDWFDYARISEERERNQVAVPDQQQMTGQWTTERKLRRAGSFADRSISALRKDDGTMLDRPGYNELIDAVLDHPRPCGIVVQDIDRLWRDDIQQQLALMEMSQQGQLKLVATTSGTIIELGNEDSELAASVQGLLNRYAMRKTRKKHKERLVLKAERGEYHGGVRAWGYEHESCEPILDVEGNQKLDKRGAPRVRRAGRLVIVPAERDQIQEAARRLLSGEATRSIVLDFTRRGIKTPAGADWQVTTLVRAIQLPKLAGIRQHRGTKHAATEWEPILTADEHERLVALFAARKLGPRGKRGATVHLLAGMLKCSCGRTLTISKSEGVNRYRCQAKGNGGCSSAGVVKEQAERVVFEKLIEHVDSDKLVAAIKRHEAELHKTDNSLAQLVSELRCDRARLVEISDDYTDGVHDRETYLRMRDRVQGRIEQNERLLQRKLKESAAVPSLQWAGRGDELRQAWEYMELDERIDVIASACELIDVLPGLSGTNRHNAEQRMRDRIQPVWRQLVIAHDQPVAA
jgi:site-specific DNA recombinase